MFNIPTPRFRGNAIDYDGQWGWELLITFMGDGDEGTVLQSNTLFGTKELAIEDMMKAIKLATKVIAEMLGVTLNHGGYIDMKSNQQFPFDKKDMQ